MAQRIIWTDEAENDRLEILEFWYKITGSKRYSQKLNKQFRDHLNTILEYPEIGVNTKIKTSGQKQLAIIYDFIC